MKRICIALSMALLVSAAAFAAGHNRSGADVPTFVTGRRIRLHAAGPRPRRVKSRRPGIGRIFGGQPAS